MVRFLAVLALSASCGYTRADSTKLCPEQFFLNPQDTDRETFLFQFKPCGHYEKFCQSKFGDWFGAHGGYNPKNRKTFIKPNVCYPGRPDDPVNNDLQDGVNLVQFDIGLDRTHYEAALGLANEPLERILIDDISGEEFDYLIFPPKDGSFTEKKKMEFGETCIETFAVTNDDWGNPQFGGDYDCMGTCGPGCKGVGIAKDCMKHDICSYFKTVARKSEAVNFCRDFDCGDEAAQTVSNCRQGSNGPQVTCTPDSFIDINPAARLQRQKRSCILRTKWDRNQGMPWARRPNGERCDGFDDCQSRRCDAGSWGLGECMPREPNGAKCNEHSDCISVTCMRASGHFFSRCTTRGFLEIGQKCDDDADCHSLSCDGTCVNDYDEEEEGMSFNLRGNNNAADTIELEQS